MPELTLAGSSSNPQWRSLPGYNGEVEFTLRAFQPEDFDSLWSIDHKCFPPGVSYTRLELAAYMRRWGSFTLVAESSAINPDGVPPPSSSHGEPSCSALGFIVAEASRRGAGHIITIDVLPAARRCGIGSKLLGAAEDRLRAAKCHCVFLETAVDNKAALAFYRRHGYFVVKTVPRYYSNSVDAFVLGKDLLSQPEPASLPP